MVSVTGSFFFPMVFLFLAPNYRAYLGIRVMEDIPILFYDGFIHPTLDHEPVQFLSLLSLSLFFLIEY